MRCPGLRKTRFDNDWAVFDSMEIGNAGASVSIPKTEVHGEPRVRRVQRKVDSSRVQIKFKEKYDGVSWNLANPFPHSFFQKQEGDGCDGSYRV